MPLEEGPKCGKPGVPSECGIENMAPDELEKAMAAALSRQGNDLEITAEEQDKFKRAFKDAEFRKMMAEYVDEISDPKYREEQNQYIREMEAKGETPKGKALIHPDAAFVIKTRKVDDGEGPGGSKVFINVVTSPKIAEPSSAPCDGGSRWSLPHLLGPPRMERDKKDHTASTFDCCFHPAAAQRATQSKPFRDLVAQSAIESVEKSYAKNSKGEKLQRTYHVLLGVTYKTGTPQPLLVEENYGKALEKRAGDLAKAVAAAGATPKDANVRENKENGGAAAANTNRKKRRNRKKKKGGKEEDLDLDDDIDTSDPPAPKKASEFSLKGKLLDKMEKSTAAKRATEAAAAKDAAERAADPQVQMDRARKILEKKGIAPAQKTAGPPFTPDVTVKERGYFDMGNHMNAGPDADRSPRELVVAVSLPLLQNAKTVDLEVNGRDFTLTATLDGEPLYQVTKRLPYEVDGARGAAKFDRKQRILNVTVPVVKKAPPKPPPADAFPGVQEVEAAKKDDDAAAAVVQGDEPAPPPAPAAKAVDHSRWLSQAKESERMAFATDSVKSRHDTARGENDDGDDGDDDDDDDDAAPAIDAVIRADNIALARSKAAGFKAAPEAVDDGSYIKADRYEGSKPGYFFARKGTRLGYHRDAAQALPAAAPAAEAAPPPLPEMEARQQKATATVIVEAEAVSDVSVTYDAPNVAAVVLTAPGARTQAFRIKLGGAIVEAKSRHNAADANVVFIFAKATPAFWDAPVAELLPAAPPAPAKAEAAAPKAPPAKAKAAPPPAPGPDDDDPEDAPPPTLSRATELGAGVAAKKKPQAQAAPATFGAPEFQNTLLFDID